MAFQVRSLLNGVLKGQWSYSADWGGGVRVIQAGACKGMKV